MNPISLTKVMYAVSILSTLYGEIAQARQVTEYQATIVVAATKADSIVWDALGGAPDIAMVVEGVQYTSPACKNVYLCTAKFASANKRWYIEIYDQDITIHDLIGNGMCNVNEECRIGQATITIYEKNETENRNVINQPIPDKSI